MGSAVTALGGMCKALQCDSCSKYVCNSMNLKAHCCFHFCDLELRTDLVPLEQSSDSEFEIDVADYLHVKKN
jgi:hypothetical protein